MNASASTTTSKPLVKDPSNIRIAMLGMIQGNGHPYSWSAIINGQYDAGAMAECGYAVIPQYLGAAPKDKLGIQGAKVTHVWCDDPADGPRVAKASCIPNVLSNPTDAIGQVDAVIIATDDGSEHVTRAKPFIEAGIPVFVDKPLADNTADLQQFIAWHKAGKPFMSTSGMRYSPQLLALRDELPRLGELRLIHASMCKSWERYGIHALESVYQLLPAGGWKSLRNAGEKGKDIVVLEHAAGVQVILSVIYDMTGAFAHVDLYGTKGHARAVASDTFTAFRDQLVVYIDYLKTGRSPVDFAQTVEQMTIIIAGLRSRAEQGRNIPLSEILS